MCIRRLMYQELDVYQEHGESEWHEGGWFCYQPHRAMPAAILTTAAMPKAKSYQ